MTEMIAEEQDGAVEAEVPKWLRSDVLDGEAREQAMDMMRRLTAHLAHKNTDQADGTMQEPIDNYLDPEVFRSEIDLIFARIPLPLALPAELVGKNSYKAMDAVGVPIVITRDAKGEVHAKKNVCRHRGTILCGDPHASRRAYTDRKPLFGHLFNANHHGILSVAKAKELGLTVERGIEKGYRETYEWFCSTDLVDALYQLSDPMWGAGYDFALEAEVAAELRAR